MADVEDSTVRTLSGWARGASAAVACTAFAMVLLYALIPRWMTVVAPQCAGGDECGVEISAPVDSAVVIAGLALAALFGIMSVTGLPFSVMLGNGVGLTAVQHPRAEQVPSVPADAAPIPVEEEEAQTQEEAARISPAAAKSLALWNELPLDLQPSLTDFAREVFGIQNAEDVQLNIQGVSRQDGPGNHAYYVTVKYPDRDDTYTVKMSRGGQGKKRPTVSRQHDG